MRHRFRRLDRPSILLVSPWDVGYLRGMTLKLHAELVGEPPSPHATAMFAWEVQAKEDPFDDRFAAQEQIPSPDDPLCEGVVALFGEWIGRELPRDFPVNHLDILDADEELLPYRLVFPWRPGAEDTGGFPLTGSTFEVLTTIAASRRQQEGETEHAPPLLLLFVGPDNLAEEAEAAEGDWGNWRLRIDILDSWRKQRHERERRLDTVALQLKQLRNFYLYLENCRGHVTKTVADDDQAEAQIRHFLEQTLGRNPDSRELDPFKGLGVFEVSDKAVFFGRDKAVAAALERIRVLWDTDASHLHWVRGPSGAGKSSLLRAGVVSRIGDRDFSGATYVKLVVRTNDLTNDGVATIEMARQWPLRRLFGDCLAAICKVGPEDPTLDEYYRGFDTAGDEHLNWALKALRDALENGGLDGPQRRRLVVGLDQFEEAVDRLADPVLRGAWRDVIDFVLRLANEANVMVIATMRDDRIKAMAHHPALEANYRATGAAVQQLQLPTGEDMADIIRKPFSLVRDLVLDVKLIETLIDRVRRFQDSAYKGSVVGSYLPLISLTLYRLYREVALPLIEEYRNFGARPETGEANRLNAPEGQRDDLGFGKAADRRGPVHSGAFLSVEIAEHYDGKDFLDVKSAIDALAEEAVKVTKEAAGPNWDDLEIADLLRRLVSWAGSAEQPFSLPAADWPKPGVARDLAEAMKTRRLIVEEEFGRIRLVHEAVVWNWPAAREWLEYELPLLDDVPALLSIARKWAVDETPERALDAAAYSHMDSSLRLLALWFSLLEDAHRDDDTDGRALLRDFCLALLDRHGTPATLVDGTPRRPPQIMLAVGYQQIDTVRRMLRDDVSAANVTRSDGRSAIFFPAFQNNKDMTELLIANGSDVDAADEKGWRPLHAAAVSGALDVAKLLTKHGARLDGQGAPDAVSPLQLAAAHGHVDLIRFLVDQNGTDLEERDCKGHTALFRAAMNDQVDALRMLLDLGAEYDVTLNEGKNEDFGWTALHMAARQGAADAVSALLDAGMSGDRPLANGMTALHLAALNGQNQTVRVLSEWLVKNGTTIDLAGYDKWTKASDVRSDIEKRMATTPHAANGKFDVTPLLKAIKNGRTEAARILLEFGADPNRADGTGATALHIAAVNDRPETVPVLLRGHADRDHCDASGQTPLNAAIRAKNWTVARVLIDGGVSPDQPVKFGMVRGEDITVTPLQLATMDRNGEAMQFLIRWGADVDVAGPLGRTSLHIAAASGDTDVIRSLVSAGANARAVDEEGLTPLHLAARKGDVGAISELVESTQAVAWNDREQ